RERDPARVAAGRFHRGVEAVLVPRITPERVAARRFAVRLVPQHVHVGPDDPRGELEQHRMPYEGAERGADAVQSRQLRPMDGEAVARRGAALRPDRFDLVADRRQRLNIEGGDATCPSLGTEVLRNGVDPIGGDRHRATVTAVPRGYKKYA